MSESNEPKQNDAGLSQFSDRFLARVGMQKPNAFRRTDFDTWKAHVEFVRESYREFCLEADKRLQAISYNEHHPDYFPIYSSLMYINDKYQDFENTLTAFGTVLVGDGVSSVCTLSPSADTDANQSQLTDF